MKLINIANIKDGTYQTENRSKYIYKKGDKAILIRFFANDNEAKITTYDKVNTRRQISEAEFIPCSYNELYSAYRRALSYSDEILGVRGVLIKPEDINKELYVDSNMNIARKSWKNLY